MQVAFALVLLSLDAQGYGLRAVSWDAESGALTMVPAGKKTKERVVPPALLLAPIRKAIDEAKLDALPAPEPRAPFAGMAKLSENFVVTLKFDGKSVTYAFDARGALGSDLESGVAKRLGPVVMAIRNAVD